MASSSFSGIEPAGKRRMPCESSRLFDVFINHRGPDVKETLATQLYKSLEQLGIRAFLDSEEKELGTSFPSIIETAIRSAKVHIAIFSKRYAESAWCLAELVLMSQSKAKIIPLFYEVEPSDLRHIERGQYAAAFIKYKEKGRYLEKLSEWKEALHYFSFTAGEQVYSERDCQKIVEAVQKEVQRKTCLRVAEYPVGLNYLVKDFERRCLDELVQDFENHCGLEERKHKAKVVGIFGMGGAGKTTLAKELFNRKVSSYTKASFLFDVREASVRSQLPSLQLKLLKDLFDDHGLSFTSVEEGTSHLQDRLSRSPPLSFLIVLDDIDHVEQLNALLIMDILKEFDNTLVIVTTRDVRVLIAAGMTVGYHLKGMDSYDGRQLFCWHAFGEPLPRSGYEELVEDFVDVCGGLPLSLQVLGRHVRGGTASYWRLELVKARKTLRQEVKKRLRISFDALDDEQKQIFMDIACFFVGKPKSIAERVWEGLGWNAQHALETLKDKCLVEERREREWGFRSWMERELGMESDLEMERERKSEIILRMHDHLRDLGREMALELSPPHRLWRPQDLEYLDLAVFKTLLSRTNVRCFSSIFDESVGSQVTFFLSHSDSYLETSASLLWLKLEGNFKEQPSIPPWIPLQNLQFLEIRSGQLKALWENGIQAPSQLKELQINECPGIEELWLEHLSCLEKLTIKNCNHLRSVSGISNLLVELDNCIQAPSQLKELQINKCPGIEELWLGHLRCLEKLTIKNCNHLRSVSGISNLAKLVELHFSNCEKLEFECLRLSGMKCLERVTFGRTVRLKYFELDGPVLVKKPASTGPSCLERIIIDGCGKLEYLRLNGCHNLKSVSGSFEIRRLYISDCPELEESAYLATVSCMEVIEIKHCEKIQNIMLATTLISLRVQSCRDLQRVAGTGDLTKLRKLYIFDCPELEKLPNLATVSFMKVIEIQHCEKIQNIILPTTLISLRVQRCRHLQRVAGTGDLTKLRKLYIYECPELEKLPSLSRQSCLEVIDIDSCEKLQSISGIEELHISERMTLHYCGNAVIRNCIHKLKGVPSWGMEMIGRAVNGAESTLNECLFSDANIGVEEVIDIGALETALKWSELSAVIVCLVVVVDTSTLEESINNSLPFSDYFGYKNGVKVREGEWIITKVATDNQMYNSCYELISDILRCGIVKTGFWVEVKQGEEWRSVDVLRTIVDRLHNS